MSLLGVEFISSGEHKYLGLKRTVDSLGLSMAVNWIEAPPGILEPESTDPGGMIRGKLHAQLNNVDVTSLLKRRSGARGQVNGIVIGNGDVLFVVDDTILKKPDPGMSALDTLVRDVNEVLLPKSHGRSVTMSVINVSGWMPMKDMSKRINERDVVSTWRELKMTLSAGLLGLLANEKQMRKVIKGHIFPEAILSNSSISGARWELLIADGLLRLCALKGGDQYSIQLQTESMAGKGEWMMIDSQTDSVDAAARLFAQYARGVPPGNVIDMMAKMELVM